MQEWNMDMVRTLIFWLLSEIGNPGSLSKSLARNCSLEEIPSSPSAAPLTQEELQSHSPGLEVTGGSAAITWQWVLCLCRQRWLTHTPKALMVHRKPPFDNLTEFNRRTVPSHIPCVAQGPLCVHPLYKEWPEAVAAAHPPTWATKSKRESWRCVQVSGRYEHAATIIVTNTKFTLWGLFYIFSTQ